MSKYPRIVERGSKPHYKLKDRERSGRNTDPHYGKPCVVCGLGTTRKVWVQVNYFRGEDEELRVCCDCWKTPTDKLLVIWEQPPIDLYDLVPGGIDK